MQTIDFRNETFADLQGRLVDDRLTVLEALQRFGPLTTRQLAMAMEWDILNVRPRITELSQLGTVALCGADGREGVYRALGVGEWADWFTHAQKMATNGEQMELGL